MLECRASSTRARTTLALLCVHWAVLLLSSVHQVLEGTKLRSGFNLPTSVLCWIYSAIFRWPVLYRNCVGVMSRSVIARAAHIIRGSGVCSEQLVALTDFSAAPIPILRLNSSAQRPYSAQIGLDEKRQASVGCTS